MNSDDYGWLWTTKISDNGWLLVISDNYSDFNSTEYMSD